MKKQSDLGIIDRGWVVEELEMISKKEFTIKKQLVDAVHITKTGTLRTISTHGATPSYPDGYVYTKTEGGKIYKSKTVEGLYLKLYSIYYGEDNGFSIRSIFEKAIDEKRDTENPSENTIRKYKYDFEKYLDEEFKSKDIIDISERDIMAYTQKLVTSSGMKKKNYMAYKGVINLIFGYAFRNGIIPRNPMMSLRNSVYLKSCDCSKPDPDKKTLSPEMIEELVHDAMSRGHNGYYIYGYALKFATLTGARVGEICSLRWDDVDWDTDVIWIHSQQLSKIVDGHYEYYYAPFTKNEKGVSNNGRLFPLTNELRTLLLDLLKEQEYKEIESDFVFVHEDGGWINTKEYGSFLSRLGKKHGINNLHNHMFRMSLNSNVLIQNGITVADRAKLLGHSVEVNLNNYSFPQKDYLDKARAAMESKYLGNPADPKRNPYRAISFKEAKSPQTANLQGFSTVK